MEDVRILGARLFDDRFLYIMHRKGGCHACIKDQAAESSGLSIMDLDPLNDSYENLPLVMFVKSAIVGANADICFSEQNQNITIMLSLNYLACIPLLHRNCHAFDGMVKRKDLLMFRQHEDTFFAVDSNGFKHKWSLLTGKRLQAPEEVSSVDFTGGNRHSVDLS